MWQKCWKNSKKNLAKHSINTVFVAHQAIVIAYYSYSVIAQANEAIALKHCDSTSQ